jgi:tetratricopeptide (TPR) repeat protein
MLKTIVIIFLSINVIFSIYSEDLRKTDDSTVIEKEMVAPTENNEAWEAYNNGTDLLHQNRFEEAEQYLLKAIELDPNYVDAMDHLGLAYRNQKKYVEAENIYLRSIGIMPNNTVPYINLAIVYRLQGRLEDARQTYLKVIKIDENDPEPYYGIGVLYQMVNQYENSITFINIAIQKYYEKISVLIYDACYIQGDNYYAIENYEESLKYYKIALNGYVDNKHLLDRINELENM